MDNNNPPAFPRPRSTGGDSFKSDEAQEGMTLRDYFAAKAMNAVIVSYNDNDYRIPQAEWTAESAYKIADEMLKAREKENG